MSWFLEKIKIVEVWALTLKCQFRGGMILIIIVVLDLDRSKSEKDKSGFQSTQFEIN